jgi:hypothetical protein
LANVFSVDGCRQIIIDVERGIDAIFEPFLTTGSKPDSFEELREVCKLLTLKQPNAILLLESLKSVEKTSQYESKASKNDGKSILDEFDVHILTPEQGVKILKRRVDLQ